MIVTRYVCLWEAYRNEKAQLCVGYSVGEWGLDDVFHEAWSRQRHELECTEGVARPRTRGRGKQDDLQEKVREEKNNKQLTCALLVSLIITRGMWRGTTDNYSVNPWRHIQPLVGLEGCAQTEITFTIAVDKLMIQYGVLRIDPLNMTWYQDGIGSETILQTMMQY